MSFRTFLKEKWKFLFLQAGLTGFFCLILSLFHPAGMSYVLAISASTVVTIGALLFEYLPRKQFYGNAYQILEQLEQKQLLPELLDRPDFPDGEILYDLLKQSSKAMNDEIGKYQAEQEAYCQYVETWIHEIKTPIANVELICKNNPGDSGREITQELHRIEEYVEQALFYARSTNVEKDYLIKKTTLDDLAKTVVKKNAGQLIRLHCVPTMENLDIPVYTDAKWLEFILGQLIANSIKYRQEPMKLSFAGSEKENQVILRIQDNGMGIPTQDISRIFDKGFTGENGRIRGKSTGMGLYLCSTLCQKLRLQITVESALGQGTAFSIIFPKDKMSLLE